MSYSAARQESPRVPVLPRRPRARRQAAWIVGVVLLPAWLTACRPAEPPVPSGVAKGERSASSRPGHFVELVPPRAPDFVHRPRATDDYFMPDIMGSGAAMLDVDGDGDLDILLLDGGGEAGGARRLYRQDDGGTFTEISQQAGLDLAGGYPVGVAIGDVDNDGDPDIYETAYGPDRLWLNRGGGVFEDISAEAGIANPGWGTAASFFDYDRDGLLDLYVANYLDYYPGTRCEDGAGRPDFCGPTSFSGVVDRLFHNESSDGQVKFRDVTVPAGIVARGGRGLGIVCRDFNSDRLPDIYVANDMDANQLWIQRRDGTFGDEAPLRGLAYNGLGRVEASMGVCVGDFASLGTADLLLTHLRGETNTLYRAESASRDTVFLDVTAASGLGPPSLPLTGFGVVAADFDHDGHLDVAIANGRVKRSPPLAPDGGFWSPYAEPNQLFLNDGQGRFQDASAAAGAFAERIEVSRALAAGDIDNDGDVDLLVSNVAGPARLYLNEMPKRGHWLSLRLWDPGWNRDACGAVVRIECNGKQLHRELLPSSSYLTSHDPRVHIGLGEASRYDRITVSWPDGELEEFDGGPVDRFVVLNKGSGMPK